MASPTIINIGGLTVDQFLNSDAVKELDFSDIMTSAGVEMRCPVRLGRNLDYSDIITLNPEPLVSVRASKTIARRNIAKLAPRGPTPGETVIQFGSVKELWSMNDYEISVEGIFQAFDKENPDVPVDKPPTEWVARFDSLMRAGQSLVISSWITDTLGITQISIDNWDLPHTDGLENQKYRFSGYSDQYFDLT